ncbi:MAG: hypothetical protein PVJ56_09815, partial [Desulfobacterales bacterium]
MTMHLLRFQGIAVAYYSLTSAELSRCPPLDALKLQHPRLLQHQGLFNLVGHRNHPGGIIRIGFFEYLDHF